MLNYEKAENILLSFVEKHSLFKCGLEYEIIDNLKDIYGEDLPEELEKTLG